MKKMKQTTIPRLLWMLLLLIVAQSAFAVTKDFEHFAHGIYRSRMCQKNDSFTSTTTVSTQYDSSGKNRATLTFSSCTTSGGTGKEAIFQMAANSTLTVTTHYPKNYRIRYIILRDTEGGSADWNKGGIDRVQSVTPSTYTYAFYKNSITDCGIVNDLKSQGYTDDMWIANLNDDDNNIVIKCYDAPASEVVIKAHSTKGLKFRDVVVGYVNAGPVFDASYGIKATAYKDTPFKNYKGTTVTYSGLDTSVATISNGVLHGEGGGSTKLTATWPATATYAKGNTSTNITVERLDNYLWINSSFTLDVGKDVTINTNGVNSTGEIHFSAKDPIVSIDSNGKMTGLKKGSTTIYVSQDQTTTHKASGTKEAKVTVNAINNSTLKFNASDYTVESGKTVSTSFTSSGTGDVSYTIKDPEYASVDKKGVITGITPGSTSIIITQQGDDIYKTTSVSVPVTVTVPLEVPTLTVTNLPLEIPLNGKIDVNVETNSTGAITLTSLDSYSSVGSDGKLYGKQRGVGQLEISIAATDLYLARKDTVDVTVLRARCYPYFLDGYGNDTIKVWNGTANFHIPSIVEAGHDGKLTWTSNNPDMVEISAFGNVTFKDYPPDTVRITANFPETDNYEATSLSYVVVTHRDSINWNLSTDVIDLQVGEGAAYQTPNYDTGCTKFLTDDGSVAAWIKDNVIYGVAPGVVNVYVHFLETNMYYEKWVKFPVKVREAGTIYKPGDANGDDIRSITDALAVIYHVLGKAQDKFVPAAADINDDGTITVTDALEITKRVLNGTGSNAKQRNDDAILDPQ